VQDDNFCLLVTSYFDVDENTPNMMNDALKNLEELCDSVKADDAANNETSMSNRHVKLNVCDI